MINLPQGYVERPPAEDLDLVSRMDGRFKAQKIVMPLTQRRIYENLRAQFLEDVKKYRGFPKIIRRPTVVDVGCGLGVGANILSQEADFTWAVDSNAESIEFAKQMFTREKNNIYYSSQLTFDVVDALNEPREMMTFDYVACVEVLEHIPRTGTDDLLKFLNRFVHRAKNGGWREGAEGTKIYLTTPNRNSPTLQQDTPRNPHHVFEPSAWEMYEYLVTKYKYVTVMNAEFVPQELNTEDTPLVYMCERPL